MEKSVLKQRLAQFQQGRCLVVGDIAIDEMIYGETCRLSREAPVVILKHSQTDIILGCGGNAAANLSALGANKVTMVGLAGKDYYCSLLFEAMDRDKVSTEGVVQDDSRPTSTKTRISGQARQSVRQQIVRIDRESHEVPSSKIEKQLIDKIMQLAPQHDALIISDYDLGVVTPAVIETCSALCQKHQLMMIVDSHRKLSLFGGATMATPNLPEAEDNLGYSLDSEEQLLQGGFELKDKANLENLLITRGSDGMTLFQLDRQVFHVPAFNKSEVFDVTGAGDTVVAALTLAMATGSSPLEAAVLGNIAASLVVSKFGTATTTISEIEQAIDRLHDGLLEFKPFGNATV